MLVAFVFVAELMIAAGSLSPVLTKVSATESRSTNSVARYDIFELSFKHNGLL
jgi:hypothetical protein